MTSRQDIEFLPSRTIEQEYQLPPDNIGPIEVQGLQQLISDSSDGQLDKESDSDQLQDHTIEARSPLKMLHSRPKVQLNTPKFACSIGGGTASSNFYPEISDGGTVPEGVNSNVQS